MAKCTFLFVNSNNRPKVSKAFNPSQTRVRKLTSLADLLGSRVACCDILTCCCCVTSLSIKIDFRRLNLLYQYHDLPWLCLFDRITYLGCITYFDRSPLMVTLLHRVTHFVSKVDIFASDDIKDCLADMTHKLYDRERNMNDDNNSLL